MKRSEINNAIKTAKTAFQKHGWALPPNPRWDVTDFGLGDYKSTGLLCVNLAEQPEYCEKLMFVLNKQVTPRHFHSSKKEDIICRWGRLFIELPADKPFKLQVNGEWRDFNPGDNLMLESGERVTLTKGVLHAFWADSEYAVVGEVSTANDDTNDNYFENREVGRFSQIVEDVPSEFKLVSD